MRHENAKGEKLCDSCTTAGAFTRDSNERIMLDEVLESLSRRSNRLIYFGS